MVFLFTNYPLLFPKICDGEAGANERGNALAFVFIENGFVPPDFAEGMG